MALIQRPLGRLLLCVLGVGFVLLISYGAIAQSLDPGLQFRNEQERQRVEQEQFDGRQNLRVPQEQPTVDERLVENESPCFSISKVDFVGAQSFAFPYTLVDLPVSLGGAQGDDYPEGRCLGVSSVAILQQRAQNALIASGYVTSRVLVGSQDLSSGTLELTVIPGRIGQVLFARPDEESVQTRWFNALPSGPGDLLNIRDVEQALENFKRPLSAQADIRIAPASQNSAPGQSDLLIDYKQDFPFRLTLNANNFGAYATGRDQGSATLSWDNPLGLNDLFYATYNHGLDFLNPGGRSTDGNTVYYAVPYGYWNISANRSVYGYYQTVAGNTRNYIFSGTSSANEIKLSRVLFRDSQSKYEAGIKGFSRSTNSYIDNTEVGVQSTAVGGWEGSLNAHRYIGQGALDANITWRQGTGAFGSQPAPGQSLGLATSQMKILKMDASTTLPFGLLGASFQYSGSWRWQNAWTPLMPQDQFAIGGPYTVRGFDGNNQLAASRGYLVRNDLTLLLWQDYLSVYGAIDYGQVSGQNSQYLVGQTLTGAALGLRGALGRFRYDVFVAQPVFKPQFFNAPNQVYGFNLTVTI